MNQLAESLARVSGAIKMSHSMLAQCPWWKFRTRWHLQGAHDMLEAVYDMLYQATLTAAAIKAKEERQNEQNS